MNFVFFQHRFHGALFKNLWYLWTFGSVCTFLRAGRCSDYSLYYICWCSRNGFRKWIGFLLAWFGAIAGAWFLYWISDKIAGNLLVVKLQQRYDFDLNKIDNRHIFWVLLASRIFPVVPTPIINIGSALAGVSPKIFLSSSIIGKMPWAFVYVALVTT
jgi:membrane protein DedA with SNARE-associated domain